MLWVGTNGIVISDRVDTDGKLMALFTAASYPSTWSYHTFNRPVFVR